MNTLISFCVLAVLAGMVTVYGADAPSAAKDSQFYELRVYYAASGKLEDLHARFRNHTTMLFEKHGIVNVGYWVPLDNTENKLIYLLAYPSREARDKSWKAFGADPEWQKAYKASEVNGALVAKVEQTFLTATDYSQRPKPSADGEPRTFELRDYTAASGKLGALNARFRDHTLALFSKHGMTHIGYWTPAAGERGADNKLIYILAHKSKEAAAASFKTFREDPDWIKARTASETEAGGSLTEKDGVKSLFMAPTDYSRMK